MTKEIIVHLDAGHGGEDPGAVDNVVEKDVILPVTLEAGRMLTNYNVKVVYSRTTDMFIALSKRSEMANNNNADVFVSIHANAATNKQAQGVETFSYPNSKNGSILARHVQDSILKDKLYTKDRGIKTANFSVLRNTKATAILVELAFVTNIEDSDILKQKQKELAGSIAKGVLNFLGVRYMVEDKKDTDLIKLNLHGQDMQVEGIRTDNTNYVPIRFIEQLGYSVTWKDGKVQI